MRPVTAVRMPPMNPPMEVMRRDADEIDFLRDGRVDRRRRRIATHHSPRRVDAEADNDQQQAETDERNADAAITARLSHIKACHEGRPEEKWRWWPWTSRAGQQVASHAGQFCH